MKKRMFLSVVALMVAFAAGAQNKVVDELATKYTNKESFTVVNMEGEMIKGLGGMLNKNGGSVNMNNEDVSKILEGISAVTVIVSEKAHAEFAAEIGRAIDAVEYTPMVSHVSDGTHVKVLTTDLKKGKYKGSREMVISVIENEGSHVLVRVIGNIDPATMAKVMQVMNK